LFAEFHAISAALGAVASESLRLCIGSIFKRVDERKSTQRKAVSDQCQLAKRQATDCLAKAVEYLTGDCNEQRRVQLASLIKHEVKVLGQSVRDLNAYSAELGLPSIPNGTLIAYRQALTWQLNNMQYKRQAHEAPDVSAAYRNSEAFQTALTRLHIEASSLL
jgi:uncharacterized protein YoxC